MNSNYSRWHTQTTNRHCLSPFPCRSSFRNKGSKDTSKAYRKQNPTKNSQTQRAIYCLTWLRTQMPSSRRLTVRVMVRNLLRKRNPHSKKQTPINQFQRCRDGLMRMCRVIFHSTDSEISDGEEYKSALNVRRL